MTNIDQFESVFKAADKQTFALDDISIKNVLVITDGSRSHAETFSRSAQQFLHILSASTVAPWAIMPGDSYGSVPDLMEQIESASPDLVCTYRNLHIPVSEHHYSLGVYLDVLTQATDIPIVVLPHPDESQKPLESSQVVMAITDHLTGDHRLVSYAARFTDTQGDLILTHVEDLSTFERYVTTIGKIPSIDTDSAHEAIREQLLKEPRQYIASCRDVLHSTGLSLNVREVVMLGHQLSDYRRLIEINDVDLLVLNSKDDQQMAMHGLAYPLTVELRQTPMLLL